MNTEVFTKELVIEAIKKIEQEPGLLKGRGSTTYDLKYEDKAYPPILVLSIANQLVGGKELVLSDFGNSTSKPFKLLQDLGFIVTKKNNFSPNVWIEKTIVRGRRDREIGDYKFGKRLWSPQTDRRGADIYRNMRQVKVGDRILHFSDNEGFTGVSVVQKSFSKGIGVQGSQWEGDAYIIELENFKSIEKIDRHRILNDDYKNLLNSLRQKYDVFYNRNLNLRQGAYLTECPQELYQVINKIYQNLTGSPLPHFKGNEISKADMSIFRNNDLLISKTFSVNSFIKLTNDSGLVFRNILLNRFTTSIISKSFLILTGLSGSGKTKLAQAFAKWISADQSQYEIVPVGADWTNRDPLLGYPNAITPSEYVLPETGVLQLLLRAEKHPELPFFLILDEMNLSHVERYFADFLSAIESKESIKLHSHSESISCESCSIPSTLSIPENFFIIGTVNIDETTYMFSPKVLDRANVIEFRVSEEDMSAFLTSSNEINMKELESKGVSMGESFVELATSKAGDYEHKEVLNDELVKFFKELKKVGAEFGYRSASEIQRFASKSTLIAEDWTFEEMMDAAISQKLLPKLHGSRRKLEKVLFQLADLCHTDTEKGCEELFKNHDDITSDLIEKTKYPVSFEKLVRMHKGLIDNGFTSFAEA